MTALKCVNFCNNEVHVLDLSPAESTSLAAHTICRHACHDPAWSWKLSPSLGVYITNPQPDDYCCTLRSP
jgi:hypothetical protein